MSYLTAGTDRLDEPRAVAGGDRARLRGRRDAGWEQAEHVAAEAAADHARAGRARRPEPADGALDRVSRGLVVVAQAGVRGVEERPERRGLAVLERANGGLDAGVLGEHVADAAVERGGEGAEIARARVAQRAQAEQRARSLSARRAL